MKSAEPISSQEGVAMPTEPAAACQPLRVAFETFGCRSNYADTVDLQLSLVERGAVPCNFESEADVYVINTCTVTDDADKSALRLIRKARARSPHARIVVTGCLAEVGRERVQTLQAADYVVGPGSRKDVLAAILASEQVAPPSQHTHELSSGGSTSISQVDEDAEPRSEKKKRIRSQTGRKRLVPFISDSLNEPLSHAISGPGSSHGEVKTRARFHLRVQEGCENSCTFCIIPESRGGLASRPIPMILEDISQLYQSGYREVVLTGTHLGGYGEDRGESLLKLLEAVDGESPIRRIRLSSIDPNDVSPAMIDLFARSDAFCNHLHICVQAFSDAVLKRMNRRYRLEKVYEIASYIGEKLPGCCIGSDLIAGFPGESRQDVDQAIERFLELPISYLHVFPYSERSGTAAVRLDGAVPNEERKRRAARWRAVAERRRADYAAGLVGRRVEIVVERASDGQLTGTTREFVQAAGPITSADRAAADFVGRTISFIGSAYDAEEAILRCE